MLDAIVLFCLYLTANAQYSIYPSELYDVLFGNLTSLSSMLPSDTPEDDEGPDEPSKPTNITIPDIREVFYYNISEHATHYDMLDFHAITQQVNNLTRRWYYEDQDDSGFILDFFNWKYYEDEKKGTLSRVNIQWLLHSRYFVSRALRQREEVRKDKRFQLGYLFNRVRRLNYEQLKICSTAESYANYKHRSINVYMRLYEQVVRLDVDIRDTIDLIRATYVSPAPYDSIKPTQKDEVHEEEEEG